MRTSNLVAAALGALTVLSAGAAFAYPGQQLAAQAKVSLPRARATALRAAPGTIVSQELEKESGGSGLRFTFDIKTARGVREVGVDAKTGSVIENIAEKSEAAHATGGADGEASDGG